MGLFGKKKAEVPQDGKWTFEELEWYFQKEGRKRGNSPYFREVADAFRDFARLQREPVDEGKAIDMVKADVRLKEACQAYEEHRRDAITDAGKERLKAVAGLEEFRGGLNLDQARDMRVVRENKGKTWREAGPFQTAYLEVDPEKLQVTGEAVSQRIKVTYGDKKGFFTERFVLENVDTQLNRYTAEIGQRGDQALGEVFQDHRDQIKTILDDVAVTGDTMRNDSLRLHLGDRCRELLEDPDPERQRIGQRILGDKRVFEGALQVLDNFSTKIAMEFQGMADAAQKDEVMNRALKVKRMEMKPEVFAFLQEHKEILKEVPLEKMELTRAERDRQCVILGLTQLKESMDQTSEKGRTQAEAVGRMLQNEELIDRCVHFGKAARVSQTAADAGNLSVDQGDELTSRNIASSRIAELLGIGNIIAHSEKMTVKAGDKVMTGCFMEFAEGSDLNAQTARTKHKLTNMAVTPTAGFNKDMTTLEIFDYLCAQNDRHTGNMFYKLSEKENKDGKYLIEGIQGIDSDLAFGAEDIEIFKNQGRLSDLIFIDDSLADRIEGLNRDALEYALGDLIPQNQIDKMMERVEKFQRHMTDNMVRIKDGKWDLEEYAIDAPEEGLKERGKRYVKGLQNLFTPGENDKNHKIGYIREEMDAYRALREADPNRVALSFKELKEWEARENGNRARRERIPGKPVLGKYREEQAAKKAPENGLSAPESETRGQKQEKSPKNKGQAVLTLAVILTAALSAGAAFPSMAGELSWSRRDDGWHCYLEDGSPALGWVEYQGKSYYLVEGGLALTDRLTSDGYYVDGDGAWYERREEILDIAFTAPHRTASAESQWSGKESMEKLCHRLNQDLGDQSAYRMRMGDQEIEYVKLETVQSGSSSGKSRQTGTKKTVLLGLYREPDQGRFRLDIRLDLDSGNGYLVLKAMACQISQVPEILTESLYSAWEKDNRWGINRERQVRAGDCMILYVPGDGYGRFYISPAKEGN